MQKIYSFIFSEKKGQAFLYHIFHEVLLNIPILEFELFVLVKKLVLEQQTIQILFYVCGVIYICIYLL